MEEIKSPKKERKFLKAMGEVALTLLREILLNVGKKAINKVGRKREGLVITMVVLASSFAFAQYPTTGNKQRLGFQTTADGLVWRGSISDTASIQPVSNQNAWVIIDTVNLKIYSFDFTSNVWNQINPFNQPIDSLFFKTTIPPNNVDTAKMRWDSELGTVVLGMYDKVPNELGFKNFWLVKNQTGSTITKNSLVYASGTVGASGRISVSKFIANGTIDAKYLLGITAHDLENGEDGYVISFGKIRQVNTDTFAAGAILYPSPTVAGVWTDVEPVAPNLDLPIGFCINSSSNNGTIAIRYASGYKLHELHDLAISSPVDKASLYYSGGLWRDTTAALLTSDTASMLTPYFRDADTTSLNLVSRFATKQNILNGTGFVKASETTISYDNSTYLTTSSAASTYLPLTGGTVSGTINRQEGSHDGSSSTFYYNILNYFAKRDNNKGNQTAQITFTDRPGTATFENNVRTSDIYLMTAKNFSGGQLGQYLDTTFSVVANQDGGRIGISKLNPAYKLDVNGTFNASGNSLIGGTLSVTSTTTLTGALTVNNATVLNEGSGDFDTRIESDGNANMVFVDASTNRVGIGTATPSKTLDVVGTLGVSGVATFAGNTVIDGGLKAKILKESGTGGFFNQIPSDVVTYIFEYTGATTGGGSTDFLGSPSSHTNRIINIINVSDVDYYLGFMTNLPYIKTNTTISELDYGQSITVQSDGSKWWVISRNF